MLCDIMSYYIMLYYMISYVHGPAGFACLLEQYSQDTYLIYK